MPKSFLQNVTSYSSFMMLTQVVTLVAGILTRKYLGPVHMGVWAILQVILVYAAYTTLGVGESISRKIPYYLASGDEESATRVKNQIFSFSLVTAVIVAGLVLLYAQIRREHLPVTIYHGLWMIAGLIILQRLSNLSIAFLRGLQLFDLAGKQMFFSALLNALLIAWLATQYKFYGFMAAMALCFCFNLLYIRFHHQHNFKWFWQGRELCSLIKFGFPLTLATLIDALFLTIDKIMIAKFLGLYALGIYTTALLAFKFLSHIPNSIGIVLIPKFHSKHGETGDVRALKEQLLKSVFGFETLLPILIAGVWFFMPVLIPIVLPEYMEALPAMKVLVLGVYFLGVTEPFIYYLTVLEKQKQLIPVSLLVSAVAIVGNYWALKTGWGLVGVALATSAALVIKWIALFLLSTKDLLTGTERWIKGVKTLGIFLNSFFLLLVLAWFIPTRFENVWFVAFVQFFTFLCFWLPLLLKMNTMLDLSKRVFGDR